LLAFVIAGVLALGATVREPPHITAALALSSAFLEAQSITFSFAGTKAFYEYWGCAARGCAARGCVAWNILRVGEQKRRLAITSALIPMHLDGA